MAVGTVLISVTPKLSGSSDRANTSLARMTRPPALRGTNNSKTDRSKQMDVLASTPPRSSASKKRRAQSTKATLLRCSMATPLGWPVEPEV